MEKNQESQSFKPNGNLNVKKPKFSIYWIYGIILLALLGLQFFTSGASPKRIGNTDVYSLVDNKEIQKIVYVKKDEKALIYLKESILRTKNEYKSLMEDNLKGPHFYTDISDYTVFKTELNAEIQKNIEQETQTINADTLISS